MKRLINNLIKNKSIIMIVLASFIIRMLFSIDNCKSLFIDIKSYELTGLKILSEGLFNIGAYHPPAYPLLIAFAYKFLGNGYIYVYFLQAVLGAAITLLIYLIGTNVFDRRTGLTSAGLSLLYWPLTLYSGILMSEILFLFLLLSGIYFILKGIDSHKGVLFVLSGVCFAFSTLTRSINMLFIALIPIVYVLFSYSKLKLQRITANISLYVISFALVLTPWTINNYFVYKEFIPVDTLSGLNLYIGNNEKSPKGLYVTLTKKDYEEGIRKYAPSMKGKKEVVVNDKTMREAAVGYIMSHPMDFAGKTVYRMGLFLFYDFWQGEFFTIDWILETYMKNNSMFSSKLWVYIVYFCDIMFFILGVLGFKGLFRNKKGLVLIGFVAYYFLLTSVFYISARYRLPVIPFLSIAAATLFTRARGRSSYQAVE